MPPGYHSFTKPTVFRLEAPTAHHVQLVIRLASRDDPPSTHAMHKGMDGVWTIRLELRRGRHLYHFLVDHIPKLDPASRGTVHDDHHGPCSMREVGH